MLQPTEIDNYDSSNNMVGKKTIGYPTPSFMQLSVHNYQNATTYSDTETLYDGYSRANRVALSNGQSSNPWYGTDICFDANGNASFQSYSYQGNGFAQGKVCSGSGDSYAYDALGRVTSITHADGTSIQYTYRGRATEVTDENGVSRITQVDGLGRTTAVCEVSGNNNMPGSGLPASCGMDIANSGFLTQYAYDLANHKITITQGAQQRVFQTDWLGRTIFTQEQERGTTNYTYVYNSTGMVVTRQRPEANQTNASVFTTTTTQYDALGRVVSVNYVNSDNSPQVTPNKVFNYDTNAYWLQTTATNLKGHLAVIGALTSASDHTGALFSYDAMGRVTNMWQCSPSICGTSSQASRPLSFSYDWTGNLTSEGDAASGNIAYTRSIANEVTSVINQTYNSTDDPGNLVPSVQNGPNGPVSYQLGNGLTTVFSYDALGMRNGQWVCAGSSSPGCTGGTERYGYWISIRGPQVTEACDDGIGPCAIIGHDEFNRLTSRTPVSGTQSTYSYVYDRYGNRWQENTNGAQLSYISANNHINLPCVHQISGICYDAAGNITWDGVHSYTYDAEGNILNVDNGSTAVYVYDALNRRVSTQTTSGTTEYIFDYAGRRISSWLASNNFGIEGRIYWDGMPIAFHSWNNYIFFQHQDWLGTERVRTDYAGAIADTDVSMPFGDFFGETFSEAYANQDNNHFAGLERDTETSTDHAQFRQYSESQGNWMSPDPYDGSYDFSNPQSFNRYSYVLNNPLSFTDPMGLELQFGTDGCLYDWTGTTLTFVSCGGGAGGGTPGSSSSGGGGGGGGKKPAPSTCTGIGYLIGVGGNADLGVINGVSAQGSAMVGTTSSSTGGTLSGGSMAGGPLGNSGAPTQTTNSFVFGAYLGGGLQVSGTNAGSIQALHGPFSTLAINAGLGFLNFGVSLSWSGGIVQGSISFPALSFGGGLAVSYTTTPTGQKTTSSVPRKGC